VELSEAGMLQCQELKKSSCCRGPASHVAVDQFDDPEATTVRDSKEGPGEQQLETDSDREHDEVAELHHLPVH